MSEPYTHHSDRGIWLVADMHTGSTTLVKEVFDPDDEGTIYWKNHSHWFENYKQQPYIFEPDVIDIVYADRYLDLADRAPAYGKVKYYAPVPLSHRCFIVTSRFTLDELVKDEVDLEALKRRFITVDATDYDIDIEGALKKLKEAHDDMTFTSTPAECTRSNCKR